MARGGESCGHSQLARDSFLGCGMCPREGAYPMTWKKAFLIGRSKFLGAFLDFVNRHVRISGGIRYYSDSVGMHKYIDPPKLFFVSQTGSQNNSVSTVRLVKFIKN